MTNKSFETMLRQHFAIGLATDQETAHIKLVEQTKDDLRILKDEYIQARDPRAIFTDVYEQITGMILEIMKDPPEDGFIDSMWLATLDYRLAQLYIGAAKNYDKARQKVPEVWKYAFGAIGAGKSVPRSPFPPKVTTMQSLLIPIFVHTLHDIPLALAEMAVAEAANQLPSFSEAVPLNYAELDNLQKTGRDIRIFHAHIHDYYKINELLIKGHQKSDTVIDTVQLTAQSYSGTLEFWDWLGWYYDEMLTFRALQLMRGMSWHDATQLIEAISELHFNGIKVAIVERTNIYITEFINPHSPLLDKLIWFSRLISGLMRKWPQVDQNTPDKYTKSS